MIPVRKTDSASQSCSCTSCVFNSESEQPSIRKFVAYGSRIDKLYYGKYIPLRERKLLNRLVRTRAVYDDLRARLISESTSSLEKNADLRPGKRHFITKASDSEKSGAILEIVDIIDKGAAFDSKKLSECCSCCSCSSKSKIPEQSNKKQRHKRAYAGIYKVKHGQMRQTGRKGGAYHKTSEIYERKFVKSVPGRLGERYNKRGVHFKSKRVRSDPCICTYKFSDLIKRHSKSMFKKEHPLPLEQTFIEAEKQYIFEINKKQNIARKSLRLYKDLQHKLKQDVRKLNESRENIKQKLQLHAKNSLEKIKQAKKKIKTDFESGIRNSVRTIKSLHQKRKASEPVEHPEEETIFEIKKDSVVKFKDYLKKRALMKDWECDPECEPDSCVPEKCFKILTLRRLKRRKLQRNGNFAAKPEMIGQKINVGEPSLKKSNSGMETERFTTTTGTHIKKQKPALRAEGVNQTMQDHLVNKAEQPHKGGIEQGFKNVAKISDETLLIPSAHEEHSISHKKRKQAYIRKKDKTLKETESRLVQEDKSNLPGRRVVRIKSSFSFDIEIYKNPLNLKMSRSSQPSGIHVHTLRRKPRKIYQRRKGSSVKKPSLKSSQNTTRNYKSMMSQANIYNKAPVTLQQSQIISDISQCECKTQFSDVKTNTETKTASSATNEPIVEKVHKKISKKIKQKRHSSQVSINHLDISRSVIDKSNSYHKQAVRIGSTFSFNIEFYKKENKNEVKSPSIQKHITQSRSKYKYFKHKFVQVKGTSVKAYNQTKNNLRRCFCTLKLYGHKQTKTKFKSSKIATEMCLCKSNTSIPLMVDKNIETKNNSHQVPTIHDLLPYLCERDICIPDECDPATCKMILDSRKNKRRINKSIGSHTGSRKTKSTSSIVTKQFRSVKPKTVQSSIVPMKVGTTNVSKRHKNFINLGQNKLIKTNSDMAGQHVVRIGSSFNFNIEFYKDKTTPVVTMVNKQSLPDMVSNINNMNKPFRAKKKGHKNTMSTQVINKNKNKGPLKICLCSLKLFKNKVSKNKTVKKALKLTENTQTYVETPIGEAVNKGTKTKRDHYYQTFECEPYFCVPGECDPYLCLEEIKRRQIYTRDVSAYTDKPEVRSISSFTENSFEKSKAILVQPKLFSKGTNLKADYITALNGKFRQDEESYNTSNSIQAVRIGSSFDFSIEFSKRKPDAVRLTKYPKKKIIKPMINKDTNVTVTKVGVDHVDTQVVEPRKINKALLVRPMLKRCFCTLNLQKKTKQQFRKDLFATRKYFGPKIYTVGKAMTTKTKIFSHSSEKLHDYEPNNNINNVISISTTSFFLNKYDQNLRSRYSTLNLPPSRNLSNNLKQAMMTRSNLSNLSIKLDSMDLSKKTKLLNIEEIINTPYQARVSEKTHDWLKPYKQISDQIIVKQTGITRYLERCYCTMNVQISNHRVSPIIKKRRNKLEPYECEPGVCTPGECNPYECNKLIRRRFAKNRQKSSCTNSINKLISRSVTNCRGPYSKSTRMRTYVQNHSPDALLQKFTTLRKDKPKQSQAVRIRSNFSFNLEFYKNRTPLIKKYGKRDETIAYVKQSLCQKSCKNLNKATQVKNIHGKNKIFQAPIISVNKAIVPANKPCFCTLKFQKRGKIYREHTNFNNISKKKSSCITLCHKSAEKFCQTNEKRTNKKYKRKVNPTHLKPFECEPGICVPGECDPYLCQRIIQQRILKQNSKRCGTENVRTHTVSSSIENYQRAEQEKLQSQLQCGQMQKQCITESMSPSDKITCNSDKRIVRIGSKFSFNIEFYKENVGSSKINANVLELKPCPIKNFQSEKMTKSNIPKNIGIETMNKLGRRSSESQVKQNGTKTFGASPLLNRCICTLIFKNRPVGHIDHTTKDSQPDTKPKITTKTVKTQSKKPFKALPLNNDFGDKSLLPYECEPLICVPGKCDPVACLKRIRRNRPQTKKLNTTTKSLKRKSVGSICNRMKDENLQATYPCAILSKGVENTRHIEKFTPDKAYNNSRRAVRIGSNFSFNVEFFKDTGNVLPNTKTNPCEQKMENQNYSKKSSPLPLNYRNLRNHNNKLIKAQSVSPYSNNSRIGNFLKRCICTLKFNKLGKQRKQLPTPTVNYGTKGTSTYNRHLPQDRVKKHIRTIESYECEPKVCVPGECNPYECLKRIQLRHVRDFGTNCKCYVKDCATDSVGVPITRSVKSQYHKKYMNSRGTCAVLKCTRQSKDITQLSSRISPTTNRQIVRIGSNFSFNVEFFKENKPANVEQIEYKKKVPKIKTSLLKKSKKPLTKCRGSISTLKCVHNKGSQFISSKIPTSTTAQKRCFCTLKLLNEPNHPNTEGTPLSTITTKDKMTATKNKNIVPHDLGVFQSPPLMCIPSKCNPYECFNKIKRREIIGKSRFVGRRTTRMSTVPVRHPCLNLRNHKTQFQLTKGMKIIARNANSEPQSRRLKSPPFNENSDTKYKHATRIGSNFNFNVEFFKQKSPPAVICIPKIVKRKDSIDSKSYISKNVAAGAKKIRCNSSQIYSTELKDQASDTGNLLKRCFCTLQLQKCNPQKDSPKSVEHPSKSLKYPQIFTVGRVVVEPFLKSNKKTNTSQKTDKTRSTSTDQNLFKKTVGTKAGKKYPLVMDVFSSQCSRNNCPSYLNSPYKKNSVNDVETILPYTPSKFDRKKSKTCLTNKILNTKHPWNQHKEGDNISLNDTSLLRISKRRLTAKKSKKSIPKNSPMTKSSFNSSFFYRCIKYFSRRSVTFENQKNINKTNKCPKKCRCMEQSAKLKLMVMPKKAKNVGNKCPLICIRNTNNVRRKKCLKLHSGAVKNTIMKAHKRPVEFKIKQSNSQVVEKKYLKNPEMRVTFADCSKYTKNERINNKVKSFMHSKSSIQSRLCSSCLINGLPPKFKILKGDQQNLGNIYIPRKSIKKNKKSLSYSGSINCCEFCDCCKRKIDSGEINKGGGDRPLTTSRQHKDYLDTSLCDKSYINRTEKESLLNKKQRLTKPKHYSVKKNKCTKMKPSLELYLDSKNHDIINIDEVKKTFSLLSNDNLCYSNRKVVKEEISKGGGDRQLSVPTKCIADTKTESCGKESINSKERIYLLNEKPRADKFSEKFSVIKKSILEMKDFRNSNCVNKIKKKQEIDVLHKATNSDQIKTEYNNLCECCRCLANRKLQESQLLVTPKCPCKLRNVLSMKKSPKKFLSPCVCGSKKCAVELKRTLSEKQQKEKVKYGKPCICGSRICTVECKKLRRQKELNAIKARKKFESPIEKKRRKALEKRIKIQLAKDQMRRLKRITRNKKLMRNVKKYKNASDIKLATDNIIDLGKLGVSSVTGLLRYTAEALADPKVSCEILCRRCRKNKPEIVIEQLFKDYKDSDAAATLSRLKTRCLFMNRIQLLKQKLENNRFTHFFMHIADKNPKTRVFKPKPKRRTREPLDFQCSLYMASLRKRPFLSVYYKCPWFYPHFMTIVNVWKQFTDVILLLLAAVVWSPCILCMEGCRALMCCFFCTG